MKHFRPIVLLAGGLGLLATLLAGGPAAAAVNSFHASITCDPVTNKITTGVSGLYGVQPNLDVTVDFKVEAGYDATATTSAKIPATGSVTTVAGRSAADGDLTVSGYSRQRLPLLHREGQCHREEQVRRHPRRPDGHVRLRPSQQGDTDLRP